KLADAYILKNDYDNASKCYNAAIEIYDKDINLIKDAVYLLKRDMNQNGNLVIGYLKKIIDINKNDDEALEELAGIYENLGDKYNSQIYYSKLLEAVNYNLYIINNEKPNPVLYDKYIKKRNEITKKLEKLQI
ncbi:tetratricopeptide repeat protein, partial [Brachyspira hampsonii]